MVAKKYLHAGLGGTFDRFHSGHKELIDTALSVAEKISVGITIDSFTKAKKYAEVIESFEARKKQLEELYRQEIESGRMRTFPLKDAVGPTLSDMTIDCVVVTKHTLPGARIINRKRTEVSLQELPIVVADLIKDDEGEYISSTRIRSGQISRGGRVYGNLLSQTIILTDRQRQQLMSPYGIAIKESNVKKFINKAQSTQVAVVGDTSLSTFILQNNDVHLGIYDNKAQRLPTTVVEQSLEEKKNTKYTLNFCTNNAGEITSQAVVLITKTLKKPLQLIKVEGEEDLLVVPLILTMPLQSLIIYGQPGSGMMMIEVTEEIKESMADLISS
jgi:pantetheine-phosphate adenylyltransferase